METSDRLNKNEADMIDLKQDLVDVMTNVCPTGEPASGHTAFEEIGDEGVVSFQADLPEALHHAMAGFIERYPNWDQYRLIQAALAGFLVQNGVDSREITRLYVGNMFGCESLIHGA